jgi:hypothetical protein
MLTLASDPALTVGLLPNPEPLIVTENGLDPAHQSLGEIDVIVGVRSPTVKMAGELSPPGTVETVRAYSPPVAFAATL